MRVNTSASALLISGSDVAVLADLTGAFDRLNPSFGVRAEHGCWDATPEQRTRRAAVRRRELELAMGERFARMLPPAEVGEAP